MADLNVLEMLRGKAPGYAPTTDVNGQQLVVIMSVSPEDTGRGYGGGLADMPGKVNDPELVKTEAVDAMNDALEWLRMNDENLPEDFTAVVDDAVADEDSVTLTISCGPEGDLETTTITIGTGND